MPISDDRKLVSFLYGLLRDYLHLGDAEALVRDSQVIPVVLSNEHLARYCQEIAERLGAGPSAAPPVSEPRLIRCNTCNNYPKPGYMKHVTSCEVTSGPQIFWCTECGTLTLQRGNEKVECLVPNERPKDERRK